MAKAHDPLVVRQYERLICRLPAKLRVCDEHAAQVVVARSAGDGAGSLNVTIVDCSGGGLGLESPVFLPRSCRVRVQFRSEAGSSDPIDLTFSAQVQRISMTSRTPVYYLGLAFRSDEPDHSAKVQRLLAYVRQRVTKPAPETPAAAPTPAVRRAG